MGIWEKLEKYLPWNNELRISIDEFNDAFRDELIICGSSLDNKVVDYLDKINLSKIKQVTLITASSNINFDFTNSLSTLIKLIDSDNIKIKLKVPLKNIPIPVDIHFADSSKMYSIPKLFFEKRDAENFKVFLIKKKEPRLKLLITQCEDISHLRGSELYHKKYDSIFDVSSRNLSDDDKRLFLDGLILWEASGYNDIEPVIKIVENKMRSFISLRLSVYGKKWFSELVLNAFKSDEQTRINERFEGNRERYGINSIDEHPNPTEYLVMENYEQIMGYNNQFFKDYRNNVNSQFKQYFRDIIKARNPVAHQRTADPGTDYHSETIAKSLMFLDWLVQIEPKIKTKM